MILIAMVQTVRFVTVRYIFFKVKSPCLMLKLSSTLPVMAWFRGSVQLAQPDDGCVDWICLDSGGDLPSGYD